MADGEPQARAVYKGVQLHKTFKNMCLTLCVNTNSRVLYIELQFFSFLLISHTDTSLRGKLNRIVHKIGDYLVQSVTVTNNAAFKSGKTRRAA